MTSEPRAWERPDGTLYVRDPYKRYGAGVTWLSADDPAPTGAAPLVRVPNVGDDDPRIEVLIDELARHTGTAWEPTAEKRKRARFPAKRLLARLDAAPPVARHSVLVSDGLGDSEWQECDGDESCTTCHPPVAGEDAASPDENRRTAPCPDCGADVELLDQIPTLAPVIDDHEWLGVQCPGTGATVSRPAPAKPAVAPDTPAAVRQFREAIEHARWMPLVASHIQDRLDVVQAEVDRLRPKSVAPDTLGAAAARDADAVERVLAGELSVAFEAGRNWAPGGAAWDTQHHARRIAARLTSGVLRGGDADGGGEDEAEQVDARQPHPDDALKAALSKGIEHGRQEVVARLARAAGVSPDSEDVVGAIEAAIRAGREPEVVTGAEAAELPDNTLLVPCTSDGKPALGHHVRIVQDGAVKMPIPVGHEWLRFLVHRASAPAPAPLTVGEVVEDAADLDRRATVGTIVEDVEETLGKRMHETPLPGSKEPGRWRADADWSTGADVGILLDFPVTIVRVGAGGGES